MALSEKAWQEQVLELAGLYRWVHMHIFDARRSDPGWPDLTLCRPPELIFVELKTDAGRLSAAQREWLVRLHACAAETHVWRPRDFEVVHARLRPQATSPSPLPSATSSARLPPVRRS